jgi:transposase
LATVGTLIVTGGKEMASKMFELIRPCCAGIDLGSNRHFVAATSPGSSDLDVSSFGVFTRDLLAIGGWLVERGVSDVAMEATGVYWMPVYESLSAQGFKVVLIDGRSAKALPGRKSDVSDCQWICQLHMHGLVKPCHVPDELTLALRSYWRQRQRLVQQRSEQILLMQKDLEQMNCQIHKVLRDISGVSGLRMIRALVGGVRDVAQLFDLADPVVKKRKREALMGALEGSWAEHHLFALAQALETYDYLGEKLRECDERIDELTAKLTGSEPGKPPSHTPRKNEPNFDLRARVTQLLGGVDPTGIDGIQASTAMTLIAELGTDLSGFPTEKHFASYLRQSPRNKITGGRIKSSRTGKTGSRAATALRVAAQSLHGSQSALGAFYRRLRARIGPEKAITATARKIAVHYYRLVRHGVVYQDPGAQAYDQRFEQQRMRWLTKQATKMGMVLTPASPT